MAGLILMIAIVPIVVGLITHEIIVYAPDIARWFVGKAVMRLDPKDQAAYSAEWLAVVDDIKGPLAKIWFGLHMYFVGAPKIHRMLRPPRNPFANRKSLQREEWRLFIMVNIATARQTIPLVLRNIASRRWRNIAFLFLSQRLIIRTSLISQMRNETREQHRAALARASAELQAIIERKGTDKAT